MEVGKQKDQRFLKGKFYGYCYCCQKFGHRAVDCRTKEKEQSLRRKQDTKTEDDGSQVSRTPHGKMWKKNTDYEDSKEIQI